MKKNKIWKIDTCLDGKTWKRRVRSVKIIFDLKYIT
jgi:hypothetical protein